MKGIINKPERFFNVKQTNLNKIYESKFMNDLYSGFMGLDDVAIIKDTDTYTHIKVLNENRPTLLNREFILDKGFIFDDAMKIIMLPKIDGLEVIDPELFGTILIDSNEIKDHIDKPSINQFLHPGIQRIKEIATSSNYDILTFIDFKTIPDEFKFDTNFIQNLIRIKNAPDYTPFMNQYADEVTMYRFRLDEITDASNFVLKFDDNCLIDIFTGYSNDKRDYSKYPVEKQELTITVYSEIDSVGVPSLLYKFERKIIDCVA